MKKLLYGISVALFILVGAIPGVQNTAEANPITFDLNYVLEWDGGGGIKNMSVFSVFGLPSLGTITLSDIDNSVAINVNLLGDGDLKIQKVYLNYDDFLFDNDSDFSITKGSIKNDQNDNKADGYTDGEFDLKIKPSNSNKIEPYDDTITLSGMDHDLIPSDFNFLEPSNLYLAAVHVGSFDGIPGVESIDGWDLEWSDSIWLGATSRVPEPATMFLLGTGLFGLVGLGRKKFFNKK
jgi:hypothetical protein